MDARHRDQGVSEEQADDRHHDQWPEEVQDEHASARHCNQGELGEHVDDRHLDGAAPDEHADARHSEQQEIGRGGERDYSWTRPRWTRSAIDMVSRVSREPRLLSCAVPYDVLHNAKMTDCNIRQCSLLITYI